MDQYNCQISSPCAMLPRDANNIMTNRDNIHQKSLAIKNTVWKVDIITARGSSIIRLSKFTGIAQVETLLTEGGFKSGNWCLTPSYKLPTLKLHHGIQPSP